MNAKKMKEPRKKKLYVVMDVLCVSIGKSRTHKYKILPRRNPPFIWEFHSSVVSNKKIRSLWCYQHFPASRVWAFRTHDSSSGIPLTMGTPQCLFTCWNYNKNNKQTNKKLFKVQRSSWSFNAWVHYLNIAAGLFMQILTAILPRLKCDIKLRHGETREEVLVLLNGAAAFSNLHTKNFAGL